MLSPLAYHGKRCRRARLRFYHCHACRYGLGSGTRTSVSVTQAHLDARINTRFRKDTLESQIQTCRQAARMRNTNRTRSCTLFIDTQYVLLISQQLFPFSSSYFSTACEPRAAAGSSLAVTFAATVKLRWACLSWMHPTSCPQSRSRRRRSKNRKWPWFQLMLQRLAAVFFSEVGGKCFLWDLMDR